MNSAENESRVILALQAIQADKDLSIRAAAKIYNVSATTIRRRRDGHTVRSDTMPNLRKLVDLEEDTIVRYVLELDSQGFPPRLSHVEDMANRLLEQRGAPRVGKHWTSSFIKRHPELQMRFTRRYDY